MRETLSTEAQACWLVEPGRAEIRSEILPVATESDALVRTLYSGISRGTESLVFAGQVPKSEYQRMRAPFQQGDFPAPVKYGYISVGVVEEGPVALHGQKVFCLYPHQDLYRVPASALTLIPDGLPAERAILAAGMETAINALWDADIKIGDRVIVIGAGVIGALVAYLAQRVPGTEVVLLDVDDSKSAMAQALGVKFASQGHDGEDADLVVHASGHAAGLATALNVAGQEARIVELSWFGEVGVSVPLGQAFHARRLRLQSSQVGQIPASQAARWNYPRRLGLALSLLQDPALDVLISGETNFADLPQTLAEICGPQGGALCHRVRYPQPDHKES